METGPLRESFQWASGVVAGVKPEDLDRPTPCDEWNVRMLLNHMIGSARAFAVGVPNGAVNPQVDPSVDLFEDDPGELYEASWPAAVDAWAMVDAEGMTELPWGPMPNLLAAQLLLVESAVHGHDLAKATGQDATIPEAPAQAALAFATMLLNEPEMRGNDFKPPVAVSEGASTTDRLVAFLGRHP